MIVLATAENETSAVFVAIARVQSSPDAHVVLPAPFATRFPPMLNTMHLRPEYDSENSDPPTVDVVELEDGSVKIILERPARVVSIPAMEWKSMVKMMNCIYCHR